LNVEGLERLLPERTARKIVAAQDKSRGKQASYGSWSTTKVRYQRKERSAQTVGTFLIQSLKAWGMR
jgi:transcription elongation GreA/GreB family factor